MDYIIAGLGNPASKYEGTRHNAGFMAADELARQNQVKIDRMKFQSLYAASELGGKKVLLLKPLTFMNLSGQAVREAMAFYKVPPERLIVLFDDISLDVGKIRVRRRGTHGGHNGIRSIIEMLGSDDFPRVKIGVGKKPHPEMDLADWVLSKFTPQEQKPLGEAVGQAADAAKLLVSGDIEQAMNRFN